LVDARGDAAAMHELRHDQAAFGMDGLRNLAPASDLPGRIDARRAAIALASRAGLQAFGNDEAGARALAIIFNMQVGGRIARAGTAARHGRHDDAIAKLERSKPYRCKEFFHDNLEVRETISRPWARCRC